MIQLKLILLFLLLAVGTVWTPVAYAQTGYYPPRGPISPWMNMFQRRPGPLDNYHSYVQPQIQLQREMSQQNQALMQNTTGIRHLGQQMKDAQKETQVRPTGTSSVFMDYSHYFPMKGGRSTVQRSVSRR